jgi:hypothetical protein
VEVKEKYMFKEIDWKDLGERCIATFLETFLAMITAEAMTGGDADLLRSAFVGGLASVLSLLKTVLKNYNAKK